MGGGRWEDDHHGDDDDDDPHDHDTALHERAMALAFSPMHDFLSSLSLYLFSIFFCTLPRSPRSKVGPPRQG